MSAEPLDNLLRSLSQGDGVAAGHVFRTYEPILRMVVRRQLSNRLRPKFDSMDVVQSVWVEVLEGVRHKGWQFENADHLKSFLIRMTHRRFLDRWLKQRKVVAHQQALPESAANDDSEPVARQPTASQEVQARDLWDQMLALCPPPHRHLLVLRRQGRTFGEMAEATGLHESSIRRIFYELAKRLAEHQNEPSRADVLMSEVLS